jgi:hypothetical protein
MYTQKEIAAWENLPESVLLNVMKEMEYDYYKDPLYDVVDVGEEYD